MRKRRYTEAHSGEVTLRGMAVLPLRFVAESLGCDVQWNGDTKTVTITYVKSGG